MCSNTKKSIFIIFGCNRWYRQTELLGEYAFWNLHLMKHIVERKYRKNNILDSLSRSSVKHSMVYIIQQDIKFNYAMSLCVKACHFHSFSLSSYHRLHFNFLSYFTPLYMDYFGASLCLSDFIIGDPHRVNLFFSHVSIKPWICLLFRSILLFVN